MREKEIPSDEERLAALEKENEELRKKLEDTSKDEDIYSYRIFVEARKKFLTWIGVVIVIITAFGVVSVTSIVQKIKAAIEAKGVDNIVEETTKEIKNEIKLDFEERHKDKIVEELIALVHRDVRELAQETAAIEIRSTMEKVSKELEPVAKPGSESSPFVQALEKTYQEERYFVIAGSSPREMDLKEELQRVKDKIGDQFEDLFPDAKIYPPFKGNRNYALVIGANLPFSKAKDLQEQAVSLGFREDTFLWRSGREYFEY